MRRGSWTRLIVCTVILLGLRGQVSSADPKHPVTLPRPAMDERYLVVEAEGKFESEEGAREIALDAAREKLLDLLQRQHPALDWPGEAEYVNNHLREKQWFVQDLPGEDLSSTSQKLFKARVRVEVKMSDYQEMLRLDRRWRTENRQILLAKTLPGLVIILGGVAGYFRVRRAPRDGASSKGFMRLAGLAFFAVCLALLWQFGSL